MLKAMQRQQAILKAVQQGHALNHHTCNTGLRSKLDLNFTDKASIKSLSLRQITMRHLLPKSFSNTQAKQNP